MSIKSVLRNILYTLAAFYSMIAGTVNLLFGYCVGRYRGEDLHDVPWLRWVPRGKR